MRAESTAVAAAPPERDAFSLAEFCERHGFSRSSLYTLLRDGQGPRVMRVGGRSLISRESAAAWRASTEADGARKRDARHA
jgi:predicted DNA-binding transcriptional regulator AlpA